MKRGDAEIEWWWLLAAILVCQEASSRGHTRAIALLDAADHKRARAAEARARYWRIR